MGLHHVRVALLILSSILLFCCDSNGSQPNVRYLLYTVNPGEGFNLRRAVHMRAATLIKELHKSDPWVLVLPPWPHLYHWKSGFSQGRMRWDNFFDLASLNEYVPSIEFEEYVKREGMKVDKVYQLQMGSLSDNKFVESYKQKKCEETPHYKRTPSGRWEGAGGLEAGLLDVGKFSCISVVGYSSTLLPLIQKSMKTGTRSLLIERMETVMHDSFGELEYWAARYSMVYAAELRQRGNEFMREHLGYDPGQGNGRQPPSNGGGEYLSVHLRRRDYTYSRPGKIPSLENAAKQINILKAQNNLKIVYLASDAPLDEKHILQGLVDDLIWYQPSAEEIRQYGDGGVAIIDQWIAAHAKYFVGSYESTFSFRIREDRQLMRFSTESTFNHLCGGADPLACGTPTLWGIDDRVWALFTDRARHMNDEL